MGLTEWVLEGWVLYGIGATVVSTRLALNGALLGLRNFRGDDYLSLLGLVAFTYHVFSSSIIGEIGSNIDLTKEAASRLTAHQRHNTRIGSIMNLMSWWTWILLLWSCKGCLLFLYARLSIGKSMDRMIKVGAFAVISTGTISIMINLFKCGLDIRKNWAVSPPPGKCLCNVYFVTFVGVTNFLTDVFLICIPLPLLRHSKIPLRKKLFLFPLLCCGIFIIAISSLRVVYTLLWAHDVGPSYISAALKWSTRENFTAVFITNVPIIYSSVRQLMAKAKAEQQIDFVMVTAAPQSGLGHAPPRPVSSDCEESSTPARDLEKGDQRAITSQAGGDQTEKSRYNIPPLRKQSFFTISFF